MKRSTDKWQKNTDEQRRLCQNGVTPFFNIQYSRKNENKALTFPSRGFAMSESFCNLVTNK
ncbi:MAG: hypothetical protein SOY49_13510, partial [Prevotella sp.]|nr:hypothetical protein [Prevotella sp.]